jgi:hypothetical protein
VSEPSAKIILDSISPEGHRLTTMEIVMHRFVLAEFNTHRVFSRNSASSRAIPLAKQIERVRTHPAIPVIWASEKPGMQGGDEIEDPSAARREWERARNAAVSHAKVLSNLGVHKSIVNRLLEPFMWHTAIVSSTEWENFFGLRCNPLAQPEIQAVAYAMRDAYEASKPMFVPTGDNAWHMPYIQEEEIHDNQISTEILCKISAARCARVSYLTHDGVKSHEADLKLYDQLTSADPPHASPLEHVATPCDWARHQDGPGRTPNHHQGNFIGWDQLRHLVGK